MDMNCEDILGVLQRHSERINQFIAQLNKLKPQSYPMQFWNSLKSKLPKAGSKQHEASSSNHDSPKYDQNEDVKIHPDIQDIIDTIKTLEDKTERVIEYLLPTESSVLEKGEEKSSVTHFQVCERDMHTEDFVTAFKIGLPKRCIPDEIENVSDIDINTPLIILCHSGSRLEPDIKYSLEHFKEYDLNSFTRLAIVIIHNKESHALPKISSQTILSGDVKFKNMWIIDAAFTNALKFYDCKMNNDAIARIVKFLKSDTPT